MLDFWLDKNDDEEKHHFYFFLFSFLSLKMDALQVWRIGKNLIDWQIMRNQTKKL